MDDDDFYDRNLALFEVWNSNFCFILTSLFHTVIYAKAESEPHQQLALGFMQNSAKLTNFWHPWSLKSSQCSRSHVLYMIRTSHLHLSHHHCFALAEQNKLVLQLASRLALRTLVISEIWENKVGWFYVNKVIAKWLQCCTHKTARNHFSVIYYQVYTVY